MNEEHHTPAGERSRAPSPSVRAGAGRRPAATAVRLARAVRTAALSLGFATIAVQTLVLRELLVTWRGDETAFGVALASWLLAAAAGSALLGPRLRGTGPPRARLARALALLGILAPLSVLGARLGRLVLGPGSGALARPADHLLAIVIATTPFALVAGACFALTIRALAAGTAGSRRRAAATAYAVEAAGAVCAGILLSFVLIPLVPPVVVAGICALILGLTAIALTLPADGAPAPSRRARLAAPVCCAAVALLTLSPLGARTDHATIAALWADAGFVEARESVYGRVVATRRGSQVSIYQSGVLAASAPDALAAEETVHVPMLAHPRPRRVLLVGGGLGGAIAEALKHPDVERIDYVELDGTLLEVARESFGGSIAAGLDDPRVNVRLGDARLLIAGARQRYDVVVLSVPDPVTLQLNRFYTVEFFEETRRVLAEGGVLALSVSGAENYVPPELAELLGLLRDSLERSFENVTLLPGDPCHILASGPAMHVPREGREFARRADERRLGTRFIARYYLEDRFSEARTRALDDAVARAEPRGLNRDLHPLGFFTSLVLWSRRIGSWGSWLTVGRRIVTLPAFAAVAVAMLVAFGFAPRLAARLRRAGRPADRPATSGAILLSIAVVGFSEMALEVAAIHAYQSLYGYVYGHLALITAAFMAGLAGGGWLGRRLAGGSRLWRQYVAVQGGIVVVPLIFGLSIRALATSVSAGSTFSAGLFPGIVAGSALLAGVQFPLAATLLAEDGERSVTRKGGALYGLDLAGAAAGAVLSSLLMFPLLGMFRSMMALAVLNASVALTLLMAGMRRGRPR